jgi:hypothetical protein
VDDVAGERVLGAGDVAPVAGQVEAVDVDAPVIGGISVVVAEFEVGAEVGGCVARHRHQLEGLDPFRADEAPVDLRAVEHDSDGGVDRGRGSEGHVGRPIHGGVVGCEDEDQEKAKDQ